MIYFLDIKQVPCLLQFTDTTEFDNLNVHNMAIGDVIFNPNGVPVYRIKQFTYNSVILELINEKNG